MLKDILGCCIAALLISPTIPVPPDWDDTIRNNKRQLFVRFSPFYRFHSQDAFNLYIACVDTSQEGCDESNKIKFVGPTVVDPAANEFWYHDSGPLELQGAFWLKGQSIGDSLISSFARTRQAPGGIATGETDQFDKLGYVASVRTRGDHNWAYAGTTDTVGSSALNVLVDVVYGFDLMKGTLDAPRKFMIAAEIRLVSECFRIHFWKWITYLTIQWTMELNEDLSDPDVQRYEESVIWQRRSMFLFGLLSGDPASYNIVQIVDGFGEPIQPAYTDFEEAVKGEFGNRLFIYGLKPDRINDYSCA